MSRGDSANIVAIALRAANQLFFKLGFEGVGIMKPSFEMVIVVAVKVVNNHFVYFPMRNRSRNFGRGNDRYSALFFSAAI